MWKQYLIGALVVSAYVGHDVWKRNSSPLKGISQGAQFQDNQGTRYTCNISVRNGGGYVIEMVPSEQPARSHSGM